MQDTIIEFKVKIFISAAIGINEKYTVARKALKSLLEQTNLVTCYNFENGSASSLPIKQDYLSRVDDCDLIIFLIDNKDGISEGVQREHARAKQLNKKALYFFCDAQEKEKTELEKELIQSGKARFKPVADFSDLVFQAFKSSLEDIISIYRLYCNNSKYLSSMQIPEDTDIFNCVSCGQSDTTSFSSTSDVTCINFKHFRNTHRMFLSPFFNEKFLDNKEESCDIDKEIEKVLSSVLGQQTLDAGCIANIISLIPTIQKPNIAAVVQKRWEAIGNYFHDDLEKCLQKLQLVSEQAAADTTIPKWLVVDILIDIRNMQYKQQQRKNRVFDSEAQKQLEQIDSPVHFPGLDRQLSDAYEGSLNEIIKISTKPPNTTFFGNGLQKIFEELINAFIIACTYGSLTHILLVRNNIVDIFSALCTVYSDHSLYFELVKMLLLLNNGKQYELIERSFCPATDFLNKDDACKLWDATSTIPLCDARFVSQLMAWKIMHFQFDEEVFQLISEQLFSQIENWISNKGEIVSQGYDIFGALKKAVYRADNARILHLLIYAMENRINRFIDEISKIFELISYDSISEQEIGLFFESLCRYIDDVGASAFTNYLPSVLLSMRLNNGDKFKNIDAIVEKYFSEYFNTTYVDLVFPERTEQYIQAQIETIHKQNNEQGKNGRLIGYSGDAYHDIQIVINEESFVLTEKLATGIYQAAKETLLSPTQLYSAKEGASQLIFALIEHHSNKGGVFEDLKELLSSQDVFIGKSMSFHSEESEPGVALKLNVYILNQIIGNDSVLSILETLWFINRTNSRSLITLLANLRTLLLTTKLESLPSQLSEGVLQFASEMSTNKDRDVRIWAVRILTLSSDTCYAEGCLRRLSLMMDSETELVKLNILWGIKAFVGTEALVTLHDYILQKGITDSSFIVRKHAEQCFNKG